MHLSSYKNVNLTSIVPHLVVGLFLVFLTFHTTLTIQERLQQRLLSIQLISSRNTIVQVFWDDGSGFSESKSARKSIKHEESTEFLINLPTETKIKTIRLDTTQRPEVVTKLFSIKIQNGLRHPIASIHSQNISHVNGCITVDKDNWTYKSTDHDPQIHFDVSSFEITEVTSKIKNNLNKLLSAIAIGAIILLSVFPKSKNQTTIVTKFSFLISSILILGSMALFVSHSTQIENGAIEISYNGLFSDKFITDQLLLLTFLAIVITASILLLLPFFTENKIPNSKKHYPTDEKENPWTPTKFLSIKPTHNWFILLILVLAAYVRLDTLKLPLRYDEAYSFTHFCITNWYDVFNYTEPNNHVLHSIIVKSATIFFGNNEYVIRLPALLFGLSNIVLIYKIAYNATGLHSAILCAVVQSIIPFVVLYDSMARGYSALTFFVLLNIWIIQNQNTTTWKGILKLAFLSALGMWVMPSFLFPTLGIFTFNAVRLLRKAPTKEAIFKIFVTPWILGITTFALYVPVFVRTNSFSNVLNNRFIKNPHPELFYSQQITTHFRFVWEQMIRDVPPILLCLLGILLTIGLARHFCNKARNMTVNLALSILLGSFIVFLAKQAIPFPRTWIFLIPIVLLLASYALVGLSIERKFLSFLSVTAILVPFIAYTVNLTQTEKLKSYEDTGALPELPHLLKDLMDAGIYSNQIETDYRALPIKQYYSQKWNWVTSKKTVSSDYYLILGVKHHLPEEFITVNMEADFLKQRGNCRLFHIKPKQQTVSS